MAGAGDRSVTAADWGLVVGISLFGGFSAVMAFFYLPWHWGPVPLPVSVAGLGWLCWWLPRVCARLTGSIAAAAAPAVTILVAVVILLLLPNALYQLPLRVVLAQWRSYLLLAAVTLGAAASLALLWADKVAAEVRSRAAEPGSPGVTVPTPRNGAARMHSRGGDTGDADKG